MVRNDGSQPARSVLLIQCDQWNAKLLGSLTGGRVRTPHLDALAQRGTLFTAARCNHPLCLPSRVSMLSGMYPSTTKQFGFTGLCDPRLPYLQTTFHSSGYRTGAFGKFHVASIGERQWTFDVAAPTLPHDAAFARPAGNTYANYCAASGVAFPTDQMHGAAAGAGGPKRPSSSSADMFWFHAHACESDVPAEHSLERWTTDQCIAFLESQPTVQPFFVWQSYDRPHFPTCLPSAWHARQLEIARDLQLGPVPTAEQLAALPPSVFTDYVRHCSRLHLGDETFGYIVAGYLALLELIDTEIGRLLTTLRERGLEESTIVVFTADHGDEAGERGLYEKFLGVSSEEICRVPMIIAAPGGVRGQVRPEPVELVDLFPTLCALAGVESPGGLEGVDLSNCVRESAPLDPDRSVVTEEFASRSIVAGRFKLVFDQLHDERQFYDLASDPLCFENRYHDARLASERIELKRRLCAFLARRLHGPFDESDVEEVERSLRGESEAMLAAKVPGLTHWRAAGSLHDGAMELLIRYDKPELLLYARKGDRSRSRDAALAKDLVAIERLLDLALDELFRGIHPVSQVRFSPKAKYETPSLEVAREVVEGKRRFVRGRSHTGGHGS
jgi:arylsulfatase